MQIIYSDVSEYDQDKTSLIPILFYLQLDDLIVNLESARGQISSLEKKQKKFDAQLAEQNALAEKNASERDTAEARARQAETKSLSLTRELEELQDKIEESDRTRKQLQVSTNYSGISARSVYCTWKLWYSGNSPPR